jgi:N-acetylglutamate synthase-like GNAT family acetyltransferase
MLSSYLRPTMTDEERKNNWTKASGPRAYVLARRGWHRGAAKKLGTVDYEMSLSKVTSIVVAADNCGGGCSKTLLPRIMDAAREFKTNRPEPWIIRYQCGQFA